jgi:hypothetical protein
MIPKPNMKQMAHAIQTLPEDAAVPACPQPDQEPRQLARELVQSFEEELQKYRRVKERDPERPDPSQPPPDWLLEGIRSKPPEDVSFFDLERLARVDPAQAEAKWQQVKDAARSELAGGQHAARAMEFMGGSAWERACFLALREQLHSAWPPRSAGEALLLDEMAQCELLRRHWIGVVSMRSREPLTLLAQERRRERDASRRQSAAEATLEAMKMVERLQRLYQNAMRALLNLRRGKPLLIVRQAAQVNLSAGPQMNLQMETNRDGE